ncbi:ectonucleoside triphosphate diphosphohydrolase 5 isoform X2 [Agrilus planipennis]|uniref:nucleoside diphosphate phosphatase n=1 Tax=Agrilus planipennis TaxID=224129 RepID=A0A7F5R6D6_AGRPL|nr:ectonucleoside triphosphate diphosphohydrolase 5 isoform X2 [Agrilus planipennis]
MNSELRRRKLKDQSYRPLPKRQSKEVQPNSLHFSLLCLIISGSILTLFFVVYLNEIPWHLGHRTVDSLAKNIIGYYEPVHAVIIDAGSTGSRVLAFTFHKAYLDDHLVLDKELFEYTKPGISSFADNPKKAVESINSLLEKAKHEIPEQYWNKTPLVLRATAGLRLLPRKQADNLLNAIKEFFKQTPFLTKEDSVDIMDGTDEGIYSWFTLNFLLERFSGNAAKTVAALDLGGASTQVTFSPSTPATLSNKNDIHMANTPSGSMPVYTHSFLGLGLMAARKHILTLNAKENETELITECVNPVVDKKRFHFNGKDYYVSGLKEKYKTLKKPGNSFTVEEEIPVVNFDWCSNELVEYVKSKAKIIAELPSKQINTFSYYYDRAVEIGLIDETTGGQITVSDFERAAKSVCSEANDSQPFMCLDLSFIWILLEKGFGLRSDTKLFIYKKVNGHEISWALGLAYSLLTRNS